MVLRGSPQAYGSVSASGISAGISSQIAREVLVYITLSAISGSAPTMTFKLQTSADGANWADVPNATTAALNTAGTALIAAGAGVTSGNGAAYPFGDQIRVVWTAGGTVSGADFTITAVGK